MIGWAPEEDFFVAAAHGRMPREPERWLAVQVEAGSTRDVELRLTDEAVSLHDLRGRLVRRLAPETLRHVRADGRVVSGCLLWSIKDAWERDLPSSLWIAVDDAGRREVIVLAARTAVSTAVARGIAHRYGVPPFPPPPPPPPEAPRTAGERLRAVLRPAGRGAG